MKHSVCKVSSAQRSKEWLSALFEALDGLELSVNNYLFSLLWIACRNKRLPYHLYQLFSPKQSFLPCIIVMLDCVLWAYTCLGIEWIWGGLDESLFFHQESASHISKSGGVFPRSQQLNNRSKCWKQVPLRNALVELLGQRREMFITLCCLFQCVYVCVCSCVC